MRRLNPGGHCTALPLCGQRRDTAGATGLLGTALPGALSSCMRAPLLLPPLPLLLPSLLQWYCV